MRRVERSKVVGDESGAVLVIVALAMVALLSIAALVIDLGGLYSHDRDLQTAADAGALAGAQELVMSSGDQGAAAVLATDYVSRNCAPSSLVQEPNLVAWSPAVDPEGVTVELREEQIAYSFARVFGQLEGAVRARARAEVKYLTGVSNLFPVAIMYMAPDHFRLSAGNPASPLWQFDLRALGNPRDPGFTGLYDQGGTTRVAPPVGTYPVYLQAMDADNNPLFVDRKGDPAPLEIGMWRVFNRNDPRGVWGVNLAQDIAVGSNSITVTLEVGPQAVPAGTNTLNANLGGAFTLYRQGTSNIFVGVKSAPAANPNAGEGFTLYTLSVGGIGNLAKYAAFVEDAPLEAMIFDSSDGYSYSAPPPPGSTGAAISAIIRTEVLRVGDPYVMALGNEGSGLYSGNWRHANLYNGANLRDEIAELDPSSRISAGEWSYATQDGLAFRIGGQIETEPGGSVGQIMQGLDVRTDRNRIPADDPRRVVIIPIVDFSPDLHGRMWLTVSGFAAFRIIDYGHHQNIEGEFIEWIAPGSWQDTPPGPLYVKTVVLTE